jgi:hypothetical protein
MLAAHHWDIPKPTPDTRLVCVTGNHNSTFKRQSDELQRSALVQQPHDSERVEDRPRLECSIERNIGE